MSKFSVIYDANVLYPAPLRDFLMRLALLDLFQARWTDQIHEEWINALLREGKHDREKLEKVKELMDSHVRDAKVTGYEPLIESLSLPDPNDRHVLAAAIRCNADAIVTCNLKDFPTEELDKYSIEAIHPDDFIYYQIGLSPRKVCEAIKRLRLALKKPALSEEELLAMLQKQQLPQTCLALKEYIGLL